MRCLVTAGPSYEPVDQVRRLTNMSTGRLGVELASYLVQRGHGVDLLLGEQATYHSSCLTRLNPVRFGTTADLQAKMAALGPRGVEAVFHAAAVADFSPGKIWRRLEGGALEEIRERKLSSRHDGLLMELVPTAKIIRRLREWFPRAVLVGWKFEVDGDRERALDQTRRQTGQNQLTASVANGPAYGHGYGLVTAGCGLFHLPDLPSLCEALNQLLAPPDR